MEVFFFFFISIGRYFSLLTILSLAPLRFLQLMKVLEDKDWVHIISWNPSGKSFSVLHPKVFEAQVMPIHFDSRSYSSFTRELRTWEFVRQSKGPEAGGLFHEDFQEGRWDLAESIQKPKRAKKKSRLKKLNSRTVPRSYSGDFEVLGESFSSYASAGTGLSMEYDTISFPMKVSLDNVNHHHPGLHDELMTCHLWNFSNLVPFCLVNACVDRQGY
jgi:hypothetical protein